MAPSLNLTLQWSCSIRLFRYFDERSFAKAGSQLVAGASTAWQHAGKQRMALLYHYACHWKPVAAGLAEQDNVWRQAEHCKAEWHAGAIEASENFVDDNHCAMRMRAFLHTGKEGGATLVAAAGALQGFDQYGADRADCPRPFQMHKHCFSSQRGRKGMQCQPVMRGLSPLAQASPAVASDLPCMLCSNPAAPGRPVLFRATRSAYSAASIRSNIARLSGSWAQMQ